MANYLRRSHQSAPVLERHGRAGDYPLSVRVTAQIKDALVDMAERDGRPLNDIVAEALAAYLGQTA